MKNLYVAYLLHLRSCNSIPKLLPNKSTKTEKVFQIFFFLKDVYITFFTNIPIGFENARGERK